MLNQALYGNVDVITGDYLAEMNLAANAEATAAGTHPGYEPSALEGLTLSLDVINEKRIKVVINGGSLRPKALAEKVHALIKEKKLNLKVAYVSGDDLIANAKEVINSDLKHLDAENPSIKLAPHTTDFLDDPDKPIVSCNAYLGARTVAKGLREGADIVIGGRLSDASPVIGAAQWWHDWPDTAYDELAGSLLAGHAIECSSYATGANFSGFYKYEIPALLNLCLPIAEIASNGDFVVTKADKLNGYVTTDTISSQLLYELQGDIYLNSCVKADISNISVTQEGENRVLVTGVKGFPPPPTTKLAVFYKAGYQCEMTMNATGYATSKKYDLYEAQTRAKLEEWGILDQFDVLEFQRAGCPETNPNTQMAATTYCRVFVQAPKQETLYKFLKASSFNGMQHFAGATSSGDHRTAMPKSYLGYYPAIIEQNKLHEVVHFLESGESFEVGHPSAYEALGPRRDYAPTNPKPISSFGETILRPLGDIALARSGDKGANINIGIFVHTAEEWDWLRSFLTKEQMQKLMGGDWKDEYWIERIEFPHLKAVHFVIYGPLGRGVSSSSRLDSLGKAFAEYIRYRHVEIPKKFLE